MAIVTRICLGSLEERVDLRRRREAKTLDVCLCGPFDVLAGAFDNAPASRSMVLHWRYFFDAPELFTIANGSIDGLHWGYWFDDGAVASWVVFAFTDDNLIQPAGRTFVAALRAQLEREWQSWQEQGLDVSALDKLRDELMRLGTGDRPEHGDDYREAYGGGAGDGEGPQREARAEEIVELSADGMGIVADNAASVGWKEPGEEAEDRSEGARILARALRDPEQREEIVYLGQQALDARHYATALSIGKALWMNGTGAYPEVEEAAVPTLIAAYEALGRKTLANIVRIHARDRHRVSLDNLDADEPASALAVNESQRGAARVIALVGVFDKAAIRLPAIRNLFRSLVAGHARVVLDCALVREVDDEGAEVLLGLNQRAKAIGGEVKAAQLGEQPLQVFASMRLSGDRLRRLLDTHDSVDAALAAFQ